MPLPRTQCGHQERYAAWPLRVCSCTSAWVGVGGTLGIFTLAASSPNTPIGGSPSKASCCTASPLALAPVSPPAVATAAADSTLCRTLQGLTGWSIKLLACEKESWDYAGSAKPEGDRHRSPESTRSCPPRQELSQSGGTCWDNPSSLGARERTVALIGCAGDGK